MNQFQGEKQVRIKFKPDLLHVFCSMQSQTWSVKIIQKRQQMEWDMWTQEILSLVFVPRGDFIATWADGSWAKYVPTNAQILIHKYKSTLWQPEQMAAGQSVCPQMALALSTWSDFRFNIWLSWSPCNIWEEPLAEGLRPGLRLLPCSPSSGWTPDTSDWYPQSSKCLGIYNFVLFLVHLIWFFMFHLLWVTPRFASWTGQRWWRRRRGWPWWWCPGWSSAAGGTWQILYWLSPWKRLSRAKWPWQGDSCLPKAW